MNKSSVVILGALAALGLLCGSAEAGKGPKQAKKAKGAAVAEARLYSFKMKDIDGKEKSLADYKGQVLLVVNVASMCGNTPQYSGLEKVYEKYKDRGFSVLAFPANEFGHQEPGTDPEIKQFCSTNFGVKFPLFSKIVVKGEGQHPLYSYLTKETGFKGDIGWNFAKFLADRQGNIVARFDPGTQPESGEVTGALEKALAGR